VSRTYDLRFFVGELPPVLPHANAGAGALRFADGDLWGNVAMSLPGEWDLDWGARGFQPHAIRVAEEWRRDPHALVGLIRRDVASDSWADDRNSIAVEGHQLRVVQTPAVHAEIEALLGYLRARRSVLYAAEVALVPPAALDKLNGLDSLWHDASFFDAALKAAGEDGSRISVIAFEGREAGRFSGRVRRAVIDSIVDQRNAVPVVNPYIQKLPIGLSCQVEPLPTAYGDRVRLWLRVVKVEEAGKPETRRLPFADLDVVPLRQHSLSTTLLLVPGTTVVAGSFRDEAPPGKVREFAVLVRLQRVETETPPAGVSPPPEEFRLEIHDVRFLREAPWQVSFAPTFSTGFDDLDEDGIFLTRVRTNVAPEAWRDERAALHLAGSGLLHAVARPATHKELQDWIEAEARRRARLAVLDLEVLEGPLDALLALRRRVESGAGLAGDSRGLPEAAQTKPLFRSRVTGLLSRRLRAAGYEARTFISDVSLFSGCFMGTSYHDMPDPVILSAGNGFELEAAVNPLLRPDAFRLDLELVRCRARFERQAEFFTRAVVGPAVRVQDAGNKDDRPDWKAFRVLAPFTIELPEQDAPLVRFSGSVPSGRTVVLEVAKEPGREEGRIVIARIQVHDAGERR
jgi:hypothetical protein